MSESHAAVDRSVRAATEVGDLREAASEAFNAYGPEILSFLCARLRSESAGQDVFSMFAEDLWRGLPGFGFRCTLRTWLYALARNAANRYAVMPHNRRAAHARVADHPVLSVLVERARTNTKPYLQTEVKSKLRALRERLSVEDQTLLVLHVDRNLSWRELATVMHDGQPELAVEDLTREAARLRKRFERLKMQLREMAVAEGIIKGTEPSHSGEDNE
ncbi:MAG: hypothetical protein RLZZ450_6049 [Pseudomonadota bacterium]